MISARKLAEREQVSLPTALEALRYLEAEGLISARPRSGYFVSHESQPDVTHHTQHMPGPISVSMSVVARSLFSRTDAKLVPLGAALPDPKWLPVDTLQRSLQAVSRRLDARGQSYSLPPGLPELRNKIAARSALWGASFSARDLVITTGATQSLRLALSAVCNKGDIVAIEHPAYFGVLLLLEELGLKALQITTDPIEGLLLEPLADAIRSHQLAAILTSPTVQNPLGASMALARKKALVSLIERAGIPLIEDDVYGDLAGNGLRPPACKAFDQLGNVIYCSSLSKTLAPGWRIGWIAGGRYHEKILQARLAGDWAGTPLLESAASLILSNGEYDRHLRRLKSRISKSIQIVVQLVRSCFPKGTRISPPVAGYLLWVELPKMINAIDVYHQSLQLGISVSPGNLFSPGGEFNNYLRLNCANEPTPELLHALKNVGKICHQLSRI